jgi:hypothetical protein
MAPSAEHSNFKNYNLSMVKTIKMNQTKKKSLMKKREIH